ncbi:uncharacterized protein LOC128468002 [Spea bombifrons]|uniref:uncharacterized protein LOC128468002 n=1 Tax=Spea bombifrons TaxID=233779 RepID=UPI00234B6602|nr:uncharacterized protein LOC128468002 [Spea bombifrons]
MDPYDFVLWFCLGIAMTVLGVIYKDKCPAEPYIPIYLIVAGATRVAICILIPLKLFYKKAAMVVEGILCLFGLCWLITGGVWVFSQHSLMPINCNLDLYYFAFGTLIIECFVIVLFGSLAVAVAYFTFAEAGRVFYYIAWILLSIVMTVFGALFINFCPIQPNVPIFLIVAGVVHFMIIILQPLKRSWFETPSFILQSVLVLFYFCWLIAGCVWVFSIANIYQGYCDEYLYKFAFRLLIFQCAFWGSWVILLLYLTIKSRQRNSSYERLHGNATESPGQLWDLDCIVDIFPFAFFFY